jgi:hypothetical protein
MPHGSIEERLARLEESSQKQEECLEEIYARIDHLECAFVEAVGLLYRETKVTAEEIMSALQCGEDEFQLHGERPGLVVHFARIAAALTEQKKALGNLGRSGD